MKKRWLLRIPGILLIVIAAVAIFGAVVQHLWNWLIPAIIGWHAINFWQAVGILVSKQDPLWWLSRPGRYALAAPHGRAMGKDVSRRTGKIQPGRCAAAVAIVTFNPKNRRPEECNEIRRPRNRYANCRGIGTGKRPVAEAGGRTPREKPTASASPRVGHPFGICCRQRGIVAILGLL